MKDRSEHPVYKINKKKIFIKATILALVIVGVTLLLAFLILELKS
jgi:hypothetical protein